MQRKSIIMENGYKKVRDEPEARPKFFRIKPILGNALIAVLFFLFVTLLFKKVTRNDQISYPAAKLSNLSFISSTCASVQYLPYKPYSNFQDKFNTFGLHGFIYTSAYRLNLKEFAILGLGALSLHNQWGIRGEGCMWVSIDNMISIQGTIAYVFPGEHHDLDYETVVLRCKLDSTTQNSGRGALFINIHGQDVMVYKEDKQQAIESDPQPPLLYHLTYCSPPMYNKVKANRVSEFLIYMKALGINHYILYDAGAVDEEMEKAISPFQSAGLLEVQDITKINRYNTWLGVWTVNDCSYKNHYLSDWVISIDFDEYPTISPPNSLSTILNANWDKPWITFGSLAWSISLCVPEKGREGSWPIEKMVYHWPHYYCVGEQNFPPETCLSWYGHRKYIVNPRKITALEIHRSVNPIGEGINLNISVMHNNHFKGLTQVNALLCDEQTSKSIDWWSKDFTLSDLIRAGRISGELSLP